MAERSTSRYQAIGAIDPRFTEAALTSTGTGATDSAYQQAGARPGVPEPTSASDLVLQSSGSQSSGGQLAIRTQRPGQPGAARIAYRDVTAGDSTTGWLGADSSALVTGWESLQYATSGFDTTYRPAVLALQSGILLAIHGHSSLGVLQIDTYDPDTATWTSRDWAPTGPQLAARYGSALCQLPTGRILLATIAYGGDQIDMHYSDDDGTTWSLLGFRLLSAARSDLRELAIGHSRGALLLIACYDDGNPSWNQYASADLGASWTLVDADFRGGVSEDPRHPSIVGDLTVVYADEAGPTAKARTLPTPWDSLEDVAAVDIATISSSSYSPGCAAWDDDDGTIWAALGTQSTTANVGLYRSDDGGSTWTAIPTSCHSLTYATAYLHTWGGAALAGRHVLITRWHSSAHSHDGHSVGALWLGGPSSHTGPISLAEDDPGYDAAGHAPRTLPSPVASGGSGGATSDLGALWIPTDTPGGVEKIGGPWNVPGTNGGTLALQAGLCQIVTSSQSESFQMSPTGVTSTRRVFLEAAFEIESGSGSAAAKTIAIEARATTGSADYSVSVRLAHDRWRLYDDNAGTQIGSEVTGTLTSRYRIRLAVDSGGNVRTWYRAGSAFHRRWTAGPSSTSLTAGVETTGHAAWGHIASGSATSRWEMVGYVTWADRWSERSDSTDLAQTWSNPEDVRGRVLPTSPGLLEDGVRVRALDGPTYEGEEWTISAAHRYPLSHLFPGSEPSPSRIWRSTDTTTTSLVFDLGGAERWDSPAILFGFLRANFESFTVAYYSGTTWTTVGTATASTGFSGSYLRKTGTIYGTSGTTAPNYLFRGDHVGDSVDLGSSKIRKISRHTEGVFGGTSGRLAVLTLDGIDGTEPTSGTASVWARDFGVVVHDVTTTARYWRIQIPSQTTADGYFEAGQLLVAPLVALGHQYDRGRVVSRVREVRDQRLPSGALRRQSLGPTRRQVDLSWADTAVDSTAAWADQSSGVVDHIAGTSGGQPIASVADTIQAIEGLIEETEHGAKPVVYLARVPTGAATAQINRRRGLVYGRIVTSPQRDNVLGDELVSSVDRLNTLRISEEA